MADISSFPQVPTTVWWGVRNLLNKTPRATVSDDLLGVELGVQQAAARQYVSELKRIGILSEDNKATDLAHKWRMQDSYSEAVSEILDRCYGDSLRTVAPDPSERAKAVDWFQRQGLGEGSARNKAASYFLIASPEPGEAPARPASSTQAKPRKAVPASKVSTENLSLKSESQVDQKNHSQFQGAFPVNLNLQIHISADASTDQIEAIFSSMRKHLGNARLS
ncbi:MAG: DUF5343 domain-containing protein [Candidatus Devosia phytovorans]|uniref:DUF5343 domain-containing protein n=1 Tax=Candidatus Devosia phytovorans TaxID=3121372 RepID=A0AAJ6B044_9HYPH|nr:DUF5343 domain-containing protein [Devosia sp.]WEK03804.1 MAG: DUF5343 domain-containing protein [Devosia sp.]